MIREVLPEILDDLDPEDPRAVRSRRDLRMINKLMLGEAWIVKQVGGILAADASIKKVIELGAGEGLLSQEIKRMFPRLEVVALDLAKNASCLGSDVQWEVADVLQYDGYDDGSIVVANLFIHHLQDTQIRELSAKIQDAAAVLFTEPHRRKLPLVMGRCIFPLVNDVTRHDMMISIRAGFIAEDLPSMLGDGFYWKESFGLVGGIRLKGLRKERAKL